jgi:pyruvate ferredoxin oxidoreductase alpha subunit
MTQAWVGQRVAANGDEAVAMAVKQSDVDVVAAYPITPQTIIVEKLAEYVADGEFKGEFVAVESEHSALSACLGASLAGCRVFTATSSQGLALMHEIMYNVAGMRLPVVMAVANRALSAPIILNADHGDMMGSRDSGWIQVYAESVEEVYDRTIQLFKLSERPDVMLPSAVNFEGFIISHSTEALRPISEESSTKWLGRPKFKHRLDPENPESFGAIATPDNYYEFKMQQVRAMEDALKAFSEVEAEYQAISGRRYGAVGEYNVESADYVAIVSGSAAGTLRTAAKDLNSKGANVGVLSVKLFRPFPSEQVLRLVKGSKGIVVMDRSLSIGAPFGPLASDVKSIIDEAGLDVPVLAVVYGIGGRDFSVSDAKKVFAMAADPARRGGGTVFYGVRE